MTDKLYVGADYPRSYRAPWWAKILITLLLPFGVLYLLFCMAIYDDRQMAVSLFLLVLALYILLTAIWMFIGMWFVKVVLYADKIEIHRLLSKQSLRREQIYGRKKICIPRSFLTITMLVPIKSEKEKPLWMPQTSSDPVLKSWINTIRNLDA